VQALIGFWAATASDRKSLQRRCVHWRASLSGTDTRFDSNPHSSEAPPSTPPAKRCRRPPWHHAARRCHLLGAVGVRSGPHPRSGAARAGSVEASQELGLFANCVRRAASRRAAYSPISRRSCEASTSWWCASHRGNLFRRQAAHRHRGSTFVDTASSRSSEWCVLRPGSRAHGAAS